MIPLARSMYGQYRPSAERGSVIKRVDARGRSGYTADTPVLYRLAGSGRHHRRWCRMGRLENRSARVVYHRPHQPHRDRQQRSALRRLLFMFANANVGGDTMREVLGTVFRLPANGVPMTIMRSWPDSPIDAVTDAGSVARSRRGWFSSDFGLLERRCFAHAFRSARRLTANSAPGRPHRSVLVPPAGRSRAHRRASAANTRPSPGSPASARLSSISTVIQEEHAIVMRMANDRDQPTCAWRFPMRRPTCSPSCPTLGTREALAWRRAAVGRSGLGSWSCRAAWLRKETGEGNTGQGVTADLIGSVIERWRGATMSHQIVSDEGTPDPTPRPKDELRRRRHPAPIPIASRY